MRLTSPAFGMNEEIPGRYTCDGEELRPPLSLSGVPEGAQSLAFIVDDPDAPTGLFTHWTVWDLDPALTEMGEGEPPSGVEGNTSDGRPGWVAPCPPDRRHRYFFKAYALDTTLDLPPGASVAELEAAMEGHVLDKAGLMATYERIR